MTPIRQPEPAEAFERATRPRLGASMEHSTSNRHRAAHCAASMRRSASFIGKVAVCEDHRAPRLHGLAPGGRVVAGSSFTPLPPAASRSAVIAPFAALNIVASDSFSRAPASCAPSRSSSASLATAIIMAGLGARAASFGRARSTERPKGASAGTAPRARRRSRPTSTCRRSSSSGCRTRPSSSSRRSSLCTVAATARALARAVARPLPPRRRLAARHRLGGLLGRRLRARRPRRRLVRSDRRPRRCAPTPMARRSPIWATVPMVVATVGLVACSPPPKRKLASGFAPRSSSVARLGDASARALKVGVGAWASALRRSRVGTRSERRRGHAAAARCSIRVPRFSLSAAAVSGPFLRTSMPFARSTSWSTRARASAVSARARAESFSRVRWSTRWTYSSGAFAPGGGRLRDARPWSISLFFRCSRRSRSASFSWRALMALRNCWCASSSVGSRASVSVMKLTCSETSESFRPGETAVEIQRGLAGVYVHAVDERGAPRECSAPGAILDEAEMVPSARCVHRRLYVERRCPRAGRAAPPGLDLAPPSGDFLGSVSRARRGSGASGDAIRGVPPRMAVPPTSTRTPTGLITHRRVDAARLSSMAPSRRTAVRWASKKSFSTAQTKAVSSSRDGTRLDHVIASAAPRERDAPRTLSRARRRVPGMFTQPTTRERASVVARSALVPAPRPRQRRRDAARSHPRVCRGPLDAHSSRDEAQPYR